MGQKDGEGGNAASPWWDHHLHTLSYTVVYCHNANPQGVKREEQKIKGSINHVSYSVYLPQLWNCHAWLGHLTWWAL